MGGFLEDGRKRKSHCGQFLWIMDLLDRSKNTTSMEIDGKNTFKC